jgi:hypothetical protein
MNICGVFVCKYLVLKKWYQITFLGKKCGQIVFLFLHIFPEKKKRSMTFRTIYVYFCETFVETTYISKFLLEKYPILKKNIVRNKV